MLQQQLFYRNWIAFSNLKNKNNGSEGFFFCIVLLFSNLALTKVWQEVKLAVTNLISLLDCDGQKVRPVTLQVLPPLYKYLL